MSEHVVQQRVIDAPADRIFAVLRDIRQHRAIDGSESVQGAPEGPVPLELGSRFSMAMKLFGVAYRSTNEVVELEPDRRIAWRTVMRAGGREVLGGQVWRWELTPRDDGSTLVRATYDFSRMRLKPLINRVFGAERTALVGLGASLRRLAALVETTQR